MKEVKEFDESKVGVKTLLDSGITSIPRMFVHPPNTISDLKTNLNHNTTSPAGIPIINLSNVNSPIVHPKIVEQFREAASNWGFFQIINHGVPLDVMSSNTISAVKAFHEQPKEVKSKYYVRDERLAVKFLTNYDLFKSPAACWHDSLVVRLAPERANSDEIPEVCRKQILEWDLQATKVAETFQGLLAEGLGLEAGKFKELTLSDAKFCYPIKFQVKHEDAWIDVEPVHGGLIINIGDFFQVISNAQSVQHRFYNVIGNHVGIT